VRSHVALLRGINVGGHNKVAMSDLREIMTSLGHTEVATYIQSGNVVFSSPETSTIKLAENLERALVERLGVPAGVVVLSRQQLKQVIADNPFPDETSPRYLHAVFRRPEMDHEGIAAVAQAQQRASDKGSRDQATVVGHTLFLHTPDGLGRSELAAQLARSGTSAASRTPGTARNWATVTKLMALLNE
jgi:uncharacterized protein (DUF1697 family)